MPPRSAPVVAALLLLAPLLAGCTTPGGIAEAPSEVSSAAAGTADAPAPSAPTWARCIHPWPCGDGSEWPRDLEGPFALAQIVDVAIETSAGVLDGWALLPDVPEGTRVPVILEATPYPGQCGFFNLPSVGCRAHANSPVWEIDDESPEQPFFRPLVDAGYAFVTVNLPGTGGSEGCFDDYGPATQQALADLVEALADEPWSNGRVGMIGISASGTTPYAAAIENPPSLKTIVPLGVQSNLYTFSATPQGALAVEGFFHARYAASVSATPPLFGDPTDAPTAPLRQAQRVCPEVAAYAAQNQRGLAGDRDAAFWEPRMLILDFPHVTTSVMTVHGFDDAFGSGHAEQEDDVWDALVQAPQRMVLGQWGHQYPTGGLLDDHPGGEDWWEDVAIPWFDFWLKGVGDHAPRLGIVDWQDETGAWHASTAWPPNETREESLYLTGARLEVAPGDETTSFVAGRSEDNEREVYCGGTAPVYLEGAAFETTPVAEPVLVAGNPYLHLRLASDAPGGLVEAYLYDLAPGFECLGNDPDGETVWLSRGAADLRYHAGTLVAQDFPVGEAQDVRIDFWNLAHVLQPGHRLAVILRGPGTGYVEQTDFPMITLEGESRLVVPVTEGTLGGALGVGGAPERPFLPS